MMYNKIITWIILLRLSYLIKAADCPHDTIQYKESCYWSEVSSTQQIGHEACEKRGGHLAVFSDGSEISTISAYIGDLFRPGAKLWIGLKFHNSGWIWHGDPLLPADPGQIIKDPNDSAYYWMSHQEKSEHLSQPCAAVKRIEHMGGLSTLHWYSESCQDVLPSLCEGKAGVIHTDDCKANPCFRIDHSVCLEGQVTSRCQCQDGYASVQSKNKLSCSETKVCQTSGAGHYLTWDGATVHYQGLCRHLLVDVCAAVVPNYITKWKMIINNIDLGRSSSAPVSYTEYIDVYVYGHVCRLGIDQMIIVDGIARLPTVIIDEGKIVITYSPDGNIILKTDFGLMVIYRSYTVTVQVPDVYANFVCGLCGDWNGNINNDYNIAGEIFQEAESQQIQECLTSSVDPSGSCDLQLLEFAQRSCGKIKDLGSLGPCDVSDGLVLSAYVDNCVDDVCSIGGGNVEKIICSTLESIETVCKALGKPINVLWRTEAGCEISCPQFSSYQTSMSLDVSTCDQDIIKNIDLHINGIGSGCQCHQGYKVSGSNCIPEEDCGCVIDETKDPIYIERNTVFVDPTCIARWQCDEARSVSYAERFEGCASHAGCVATETDMFGCQCQQGYKGDAVKNCVPPSTCLYVFDPMIGEEALEDGSMRMDHNCLLIVCDNGTTDVASTSCFGSATCQFVYREYQCVCPPGDTECINESCNYDFGDGKGTIEIPNGHMQRNSECEIVQCKSGQLIEKPDNCHKEAQCVPHEYFSFTCSCKDGFKGDGVQRCVTETACILDDDSILWNGQNVINYECYNVTCVDGVLHGTTSLCKANSGCWPSGGSYVCYCKYGYIGDPYEGCYSPDCTFDYGHGKIVVPNGAEGYNANCEPVRCKRGRILESNISACGEGAVCVPEDNSMMCQCPPGTTGDPLTSCTTLNCYYDYGDGNGIVQLELGVRKRNSLCHHVECVDGVVQEGDKGCDSDHECVPERCPLCTFTCQSKQPVLTPGITIQPVAQPYPKPTKPKKSPKTKSKNVPEPKEEPKSKTPKRKTPKKKSKPKNVPEPKEEPKSKTPKRKMPKKKSKPKNVPEPKEEPKSKTPKRKTPKKKSKPKIVPEPKEEPKSKSPKKKPTPKSKNKPKDEENEVKGDPHFIVTSADNPSMHMCYDVHGNEGDVLVLIRDPTIDLEVNGELFRAVSHRHLTFFSKIIILYQNHTILATRHNITVNDGTSHKWNSLFNDVINKSGSCTASSVNGHEFQVELDIGVTLQITRTDSEVNGFYLGLYITHSAGLDAATDGVIGGLLGSKFSAVTSYSDNRKGHLQFANRSLVIPVKRVSRFSHAHQDVVDCWLYLVKMDMDHDALLGYRNDYTAPYLSYKPF